ncbi:hypothetical protein C2G38_2164709 [Gigaspora rosea]|uniref:Uncharacterized protein n=1 Tax=Gigaspora rosea TaxID=44941 RepID=A0A397W3L8_9GLOM|nr:hypothetical protein C2G38_2164709 [Gigaspora rosea]
MTDADPALDLTIYKNLLELAKIFEASINEESKKAKYAYWKTQIPMILCSQMAAFHITHVYKRWYTNIYSDLQDEPYYVAAWFSESHSQDLPTESIRCNTVQLHRQDIVKKLQNLLTEIQENKLINSLNKDNNEKICSNSNNNLHDDKECNENNPLANISLQNPIKYMPKGCPKSSRRIKYAEELKPAKCQN